MCCFALGPPGRETFSSHISKAKSLYLAGIVFKMSNAGAPRRFCMGVGSLSNHDERDDDDVKFTRRDWDENVAFGGKMKLKQ